MCVRERESPNVSLWLMSKSANQPQYFTSVQHEKLRQRLELLQATQQVSECGAGFRTQALNSQLSNRVREVTHAPAMLLLFAGCQGDTGKGKI